jgi:D-tyrosyl-tRNA(Tyr) deacylase
MIMLSLLQRVKMANVCVNNQMIASIEDGILAFIAFEPDDSNKKIQKMAKKILNYRIFPDHNDKMNKNIMDMSYELLVVPQFTLAANTKSGNRPSFSSAADPIMSKDLFSLFLSMLTQEYPKIHAGQFQANMQVSLINDGPVTFFLKVD